jgi:hypothetical protein
MASDNVAFTARPVFVGWIMLLLQLPIQLFLTLWAGGFFGGLTSSLPLFERGSWAPFLFFGGAARNIASSIIGLNSKKASSQSIKR